MILRFFEKMIAMFTDHSPPAQPRGYSSCPMCGNITLTVNGRCETCGAPKVGPVQYIADEITKQIVHPLTGLPVDPPPLDGRKFAWVRVRGYAGLNPIYPTVIFDASVGPDLEYIGEVYTLLPSEYGKSLTELAAKYQCPAPKE